jgi:hypothetical protein
LVLVHIVDGVGVAALNWSISGVADYKGTVPAIDAPVIGFVAGVVDPTPAGPTGYILTVTGKDSAGDPCFGSSMPFSAQAGHPTQVDVVVTCTPPKDAGVLEAGILDAGVLKE